MTAETPAESAAFQVQQSGVARRSWTATVWRIFTTPSIEFPIWFALFIGVRLIGQDIAITADESYWVQRTVRFGAALAQGDFAATYRSPHPGVTVMWVGLAGIGPHRLEPFLRSPAIVELLEFERTQIYRELLHAGRQAVLLVTAGLAVMVIGLTWKLFGAGPARLAGALLLLDAYLAGMTRLLHPDALLAPFMAIALLAGLVFWTGLGGRFYLVLSGVATGLAVLTKLPAIALIPGFALITLASGYSSGWQAKRNWVLQVVAWGTLAALTVFVAWPALWHDSGTTLSQITDFVNRVGEVPNRSPSYFYGQRFTVAPVPMFYPVVLAARLSPVMVVGLALLALLALRRRKLPPAVLGVLGFVLLFTVMMSIKGKKLDRYLLPAILLLDLLAAVGIWWAVTWLPNRVARLSLPLGALSLQALLFIQASPYLLATYSPFVGGIEGAKGLIMVGWGEGLDQAAKYLNTLPDAEHLVVTTQHDDALRPLFRGRTVWLNQAMQADYCVVYINMVQRDLIPPPARQAMVDGPPAFTLYVQGQPYGWVYRLPPLEPRLIESPEEEEAEREDD